MVAAPLSSGRTRAKRAVLLLSSHPNPPQIMDSLLSLYADLPSWTIPLLAAVPLLVFALVRLRAWELERDRRNLVAWKAGVGKNQLVLEQIYVHPIKVCFIVSDSSRS